MVETQVFIFFATHTLRITVLKKNIFKNAIKCSQKKFMLTNDNWCFLFLISIYQILGTGLWKYFPSKIYKDYVKNEEKIYDIILEIINKTLKDGELIAQDRENESILSIILKTEGLNDMDKISGVIGN